MKNLFIKVLVVFVSQIGFGQELKKHNVLEISKYSYHTECECFNRMFNLGELELNIELEKGNGVYTGIIRDASTGETFNGVLIYSVNTNGNKVYPDKELSRTNSKGEFIIEIQSDKMAVMFFYLGYVANYVELKK